MADDDRRGRARTVAEVIASDAPVPAGRALAIMTAVSRSVGALDPAVAPARLTPEQVRLHEDGSVSLPAAEREEPPGVSPPEPELGASIGRLLFALLVGRAPIDREDGFEPALRAALPTSTCALIARSASEAPGQWPTVDDWTAELTRVAGALAPPVPAPEQRRVRRRRIALVAALALLVAVSLVVVWSAPRWWDSATDDEGSLPVAGRAVPAVQLVRDSS
ncbi:MAG: hypothetical protein M3Y51_05670 [Actinomycetota bacterium]|nr:hypothetical protein [Actinomycetota bacterium]